MVNSDSKVDSGKKLFYGLFIFPLLIAVGMAVLLCTVVLLTRETETPESLITAIKTGSPSKRWQKAFELSNELNRDPGMLRESGVMKEVIHILSSPAEYDEKTRSYMAIALSHFDGPEVEETLRKGLREEENPHVRLYLIWATGQKKLSSAVPELVPFLTRSEEDLKKMAAYVLGVLGDKSVIENLKPLLDDASRDVQWNAALSLARLGDDSGYEILVKMVDRDTLVSFHHLDEAKIEEIMVNAVRGLALLDKPESLKLLADLSNKDKSLKVRQAAIEALKAQS